MASLAGADPDWTEPIGKQLRLTQEFSHPKAVAERRNFRVTDKCP